MLENDLYKREIAEMQFQIHELQLKVVKYQKECENLKSEFRKLNEKYIIQQHKDWGKE